MVLDSSSGPPELVMTMLLDPPRDDEAVIGEFSYVLSTLTEEIAEDL